MARKVVLPRLYVILDGALLSASLQIWAQEFAAAGARLVQYREKRASARELLAAARELTSVLNPFAAGLVVNDRADIACLAGARGVHVGQADLDVERARNIVGEEQWVGVSTHNLEQFRAAVASSADYIAVGPVFETATKDHPDPVVGTGFIRQVRALTEKPIVAIGGITLERAPQVIEAGADSVAVIGDILRAKDPPLRAAQYVALLGGAHNGATV